MEKTLKALAKDAKAASYLISASSQEQRNSILTNLKELLLKNKQQIFEANKQDLYNAKIGLSKGIFTESNVKRLELTQSKYESLLSGIEDILKLNDPLNKVKSRTKLDQDLNLTKISCSIGVICIIYQARPDAAIQIFSLAIKSGNSLIFRGGEEDLISNDLLYGIFARAIEKSLIPEAINCVQNATRFKNLEDLLLLDQYIDLIIPRGYYLFNKIKSNTKIPLLGHPNGICMMYFDKEMDFDKAKRCLIDGKTDYPYTCNATEVLLVHKSRLEDAGNILDSLIKDYKVEVLADSEAIKHIKGAKEASEKHFSIEYLSLKIAVKTVDSVYDAIDHINLNSSNHTDVIITENCEAAGIFLRLVHSAGVFVNCSTRFSDGYRYGKNLLSRLWR